MRGRKLKPAALQILHGNPNQDSRKALAARAAAEPPRPITGLEPFDDFTPDQTAIWREAVANAPRNVLAQIDRWSLRVWVIACDLHQQACKAQQRAGGLLIKTTKDGAAQTQFVPSPYLSIINKQALIMLKAGSELGFTPTARPRLYTPAEPGTVLPAVGRTLTQPRRPVTLDSYLASAPPRPSIN